MVERVLEATWEEIMAHTDELKGKRLTVIVHTEEVAADILPNMAMLDAMREADEIQQGMNPKPDPNEQPNIGPPNVGPPNEGMLAALREIDER